MQSPIVQRRYRHHYLSKPIIKIEQWNSHAIEGHYELRSSFRAPEIRVRALKAVKRKLDWPMGLDFKGSIIL